MTNDASATMAAAAAEDAGDNCALVVACGMRTDSPVAYSEFDTTDFPGIPQPDLKARLVDVWARVRPYGIMLVVGLLTVAAVVALGRPAATEGQRVRAVPHTTPIHATLPTPNPATPNSR